MKHRFAPAACLPGAGRRPARRGAAHLIARIGALVLLSLALVPVSLAQQRPQRTAKGQVYERVTAPIITPRVVREDLAAVKARVRAGLVTRARPEGMLEREGPKAHWLSIIRPPFVTAGPPRHPIFTDLLPDRSPAPDVEFDTFTNIQYDRPDSAIAVSDQYVVTAINFNLLFQKTDGTMVENFALSAWFPDDLTGAVGDPRLCYYAPKKRFVLIAMGFPSAGQATTLDVAISDTSDPTGTWSKQSFTVTRGSGPGEEYADYPSLGCDERLVYVSFNMATFNPNRTPSGNQLYILTWDPAFRQLIGAGPPFFFQNIRLPGGAGAPLAQTIKPVETDGASGAPAEIHYLVSTMSPDLFGQGATGFALYTVSFSQSGKGLPALKGLPVLTSSYISVPPFAAAGNAPQPNGGPTAWTGGTNLQKSTMSHGIIWTCQTVSRTANAGGQSMVRVFRIDPQGKAVLGQYNFENPDLWFFVPTVTPDNFGNAELFFAGGAANHYISLYGSRFAIKSRKFLTWRLLAPGTAAFTPQGEGDGFAWGDYSDSALDPSDRAHVWGHAEIPVSASFWKLHAVRVATH
jgi:hypothetical protein